VTYLPDQELQFGHDHQGGGAVVTAPVSYDPTLDHVIEIDPGTTDGNFRLRFNGDLLIDIKRSFFPARASDVFWGLDAAESSVVDVSFSGTIHEISPIDAVKWRQDQARPGALVAIIKFPIRPSAVVEPLLTTGVTGAGDLLYVRYVDATHIVIGHDHWGFPSLESGLIKIDSTMPHNLWILVPGLLGSAPLTTLSAKLEKALQRDIFVFLNGKVVFSSAREFHPFDLREVGVFKNPIGGSTCAARFTGEILFYQQVLPASDREPWTTLRLMFAEDVAPPSLAPDR
jgi:hypothetical protein